MLLSHLYDRGFIRELLHEELDFELYKNFINFIIKVFILICCLLYKIQVLHGDGVGKLLVVSYS